ncbi:MAG TPA: hypothetical protein VF132_00490 [Rudaea sp.]
MIDSIRCMLAITLMATLAGVPAPAQALSFPGGGAGPIPDGLGITPDCHNPFGPARIMGFSVTGLTTAVSTVGLRIIFSPPHSYLGDLHVMLGSPSGLRFMTIFGDTGTTAFLPPGAHIQALGPYVFSDAETGDWWALPPRPHRAPRCPQAAIAPQPKACRRSLR